MITTYSVTTKAKVIRKNLVRIQPNYTTKYLGNGFISGISPGIVTKENLPISALLLHFCIYQY
jgi:hypothetical protein